MSAERLPVVRLLVLSLIFALAAPAASKVEVKQRIKTVRELGKRDSSVIPELQGYLSDPDAEVRTEAVKALIAIGTQHSLDPLIRATRDNYSEAQVLAVDGLVNFYQPGYVHLGLTGSVRKFGSNIKGRFTDTDDRIIDPTVEVRPEVIRAIGDVASGGTSMAARAHAARALGILRGKAAVPDLLQALRSKDDQVMYESLIALQKIRDLSVGPKIVYTVRDPQEKVQIAALQTVGLLDTRSALPDLRDAFERAKSRNVQRAALSAIAMLPDEANRTLYSRYLNSDDDGLRASAAEGFARLRSPADAATVQKAYDAEVNTPAKLAMAFALADEGRVGTNEDGPMQYLVSSLDSKRDRGISQGYLTELLRESGAARQAVYAMLPNASKEQKVQLAEILGLSRAKDAVGPLETLSRDSDAEVQRESVRALRILNARLP